MTKSVSTWLAIHLGFPATQEDQDEKKKHLLNALTCTHTHTHIHTHKKGARSTTVSTLTSLRIEGPCPEWLLVPVTVHLLTLFPSSLHFCPPPDELV